MGDRPTSYRSLNNHSLLALQLWDLIQEVDEFVAIGLSMDQVDAFIFDGGSYGGHVLCTINCCRAPIGQEISHGGC